MWGHILGREVPEHHLLMEEADHGLPVHPATSSTPRSLSWPESSMLPLTYDAETIWYPDTKHSHLGGGN